MEDALFDVRGRLKVLIQHGTRKGLFQLFYISVRLLMSVVIEKGFGWQKSKYLMIPTVLPRSHLDCLLLGFLVLVSHSLKVMSLGKWVTHLRTHKVSLSLFLKTATMLGISSKTDS